MLIQGGVSVYGFAVVSQFKSPSTNNPLLFEVNAKFSQEKGYYLYEIVTSTFS
jgi:hypothetical protein